MLYIPYLHITNFLFNEKQIKFQNKYSRTSIIRIKICQKRNRVIHNFHPVMNQFDLSYQKSKFDCI